MPGGVAEKAQDPRLVASLLLAVREVKGAPGDRGRLVPAAGQEMRLAEIGQEKRMAGGARCLWVSDCLLYDGHALGESARQRIRVPEMRGRDSKEGPYLGHSAQLDGVLERRNGLSDGAPAEEDEAQAPVRPKQDCRADRLRERSGGPARRGPSLPRTHPARRGTR